MEHPLHAVDHNWARIVAGVDHALDPQKRIAVPSDDRAELLQKNLPVYEPILFQEPRGDVV